MKNVLIYLTIICLIFTACDDKKDLVQGDSFGATVALYNGYGKNAQQADYHLKNSIIASVEDEGSEKQINYSLSLFKENYNHVEVNLGLSADKVKQYNQTYGTSYEVFPKSLITSFDKTLSVKQGSVNSDKGTLSFSISPLLKDNTPYMIAIEIESISSGVHPLKNATTLFYTVEKTKGQIKKVAKLTRETCFAPTKSVSAIGSNFTMEGLVYVEKFRGPGDNGDAGITTFMGTEGQVLMRFGDAGVDPDHLQANGTDIGFKFKPKTWYHIALVIENGTTKVYVNGNKISEFRKGRTLGGFYIGKSYNDNRGLPGMVSEIRLWNVARTDSEIAENMMYVSPKTDGLFAYWKMNTADGNYIRDISGNGRDLKYTKQNSSDAELELVDIDGIELK